PLSRGVPGAHRNRAAFSGGWAPPVYAVQSRHQEPLGRSSPRTEWVFESVATTTRQRHASISGWPRAWPSPISSGIRARRAQRRQRYREHDGREGGGKTRGTGLSRLERQTARNAPKHAENSVGQSARVGEGPRRIHFDSLRRGGAARAALRNKARTPISQADRRSRKRGSIAFAGTTTAARPAARTEGGDVGEAELPGRRV